MSFNSYVNIYRLNNAYYLFENTDGSILSAAIDSGFKSVRSFNHNFKKHFGMTPNEYIKNRLRKPNINFAETNVFKSRLLNNIAYTIYYVKK